MRWIDGYAVFDVETTGLFPKLDRILEIAVLRYDSQGRLIDEFTSLVNPDRDVGDTRIHGITAGDVLNAPHFGDIAGDVIALCRDAVLVAHNASFDRRFLAAELSRMGSWMPSAPCLCTMKLARCVDPGIPGRKLEVLCDYFGISFNHHHTAYWDTAATAEIFMKCVEELGGWDSVDVSSLCIKPMESDYREWPQLIAQGIFLNRDTAGRDVQDEASYISRLIERLPVSSSSDSYTEDYLALLDRILEDRRIDPEELSQLEDLAIECGLSQEQAHRAHRSYLSALLNLALRDGVITPSEERDLNEVRNLLGVTCDEYEFMRERALHSNQCVNTVVPVHSGEILQGKSICFTGAFRCSIDGQPASRQMAIDVAQRAGMVIQKGVTKSLDYLVVADPDTQSGKARKARKYGIPILAEPVFWNLMQVDIE